MGNSQPTNRTGRIVTAQKLENAKKLGVLSLSEHGLDSIPTPVYDLPLRTLDLSKNNLSYTGKLEVLVDLKSLNLDQNKLPAGSLTAISKLTKLQNLSLSGNLLGKPLPVEQKVDPLPELPSTLKQLDLSRNFFSNIPRPVLSTNLGKLEKLDLSFNQLATVPDEISNLKNLEELRLDSNMVVSLPEAIGLLSKLKALSLRDNKITVLSANVATTTNTQNVQPLPKSLFTNTRLIDLNLHGNRLTNTQLNRFEGYQDFLERRQKVKSKTMTNLDVCGLE
jgi:Leucine-rich repeat (LRR) protein